MREATQGGSFFCGALASLGRITPRINLLGCVVILLSWRGERRPSKRGAGQVMKRQVEAPHSLAALSTVARETGGSAGRRRDNARPVPGMDDSRMGMDVVVALILALLVGALQLLKSSNAEPNRNAALLSAALWSETRKLALALTSKSEQ